MSNALAVYQDFDNLQRAALALHKSGFFKDAASEAQAIVKVMAGAELGFAPIYSLTKIHMVKGRIAIGYEAMGAKIKSSGRYDYKVKEWGNDKCTLEWTDNGTRVLENTFTMDDAKTAGLVKDDSGWKKWAKSMLFSKAFFFD